MQVYEDIPYSGRHALTLDMYLPEDGEARATIVYLHGGGFLAGSQKGPEAQAFAARLTAAGFAMASVGYRLGAGPEAFSAEEAVLIEKLRLRSMTSGLTMSPKLFGAAYIAALEDASEAVEFLWVEGAQFGIVTRNVGILGVSAGGILGASLAYPPGGYDARLVSPEAVVAITGAVVHPWRLDRHGPPLLFFHGEQDRIIGIENLEVGQRHIDKLNLPVRLVKTGIKGHATQVAAVLGKADSEGIYYFDQVLDHFAPLQYDT